MVMLPRMFQRTLSLFETESGIYLFAGQLMFCFVSCKEQFLLFLFF